MIIYYVICSVLSAFCLLSSAFCFLDSAPDLPAGRQVVVEILLGRKCVFVRAKNRLEEALFGLYKNHFVTKRLERKAGLGT